MQTRRMTIAAIAALALGVSACGEDEAASGGDGDQLVIKDVLRAAASLSRL